ncbi:MAG: LptF/LptG family permease [Bacteroidales bacterium]|nr:LptF/LptG family permease [Bacteroidales bacterium]
MKKIDIYIIKKFLGTFFYAISLLIIIIVVFDVSEKIDDFINNNASFKKVVLNYYVNFIPYFVNLFSYLFTFISVIFFTSKMASNSEIIAILSSGVSFRRMLFPYMVSAIFLGSISFYLANFLIPVTNKKMMEFERVYIRNPYKDNDRNIHIQIKPGTFVYIESFNNMMKSGIKFSLEEFKDGRLTYKLMADRILWDSTGGFWKLKNYYYREIDGMNEKIVKGREMDTLINLSPEEFVITVDDIKTLNYRELREYIEKEKIKGSEMVKVYEVEKHKRIADPFSTLIFTLIGVSLSSKKMRGGIGMQLGFGIGLTFAFILFMKVSTVFATRGSLSPMIAAWIPNFIFGLVSVYLLRIAPK